MQNAGLAELGLNWRYLAFDVRPDELQTAIAGAAAMQFVGLNLTVPHKMLALDIVDELDESARAWGAVNTIRFEAQTADGRWTPMRDAAFEETLAVRSVGFNTDADAIIRALKEDLRCDVRGASVLLLGAGGAGKTAAFRLAAEGVKKLFLVNRTASKAAEVAGEIERRFPAVQAKLGYPDNSVDLAVNATSLGLKADDPLPFDAGQFNPGQAGAVYDMIYRPAETKFLQAAKVAGCRTANGLGMLLCQGAKALEIWTGRPAPVEGMRRALENNIYGTHTN